MAARACSGVWGAAACSVARIMAIPAKNSRRRIHRATNQKVTLAFHPNNHQLEPLHNRGHVDSIVHPATSSLENYGHLLKKRARSALETQKHRPPNERLSTDSRLQVLLPDLSIPSRLLSIARSLLDNNTPILTRTSDFG